MATPPVDADATASRVSSSSTARNPTSSAAQRRPDAVQLSAADCSVGDDTGASVALAASASASASEQQQQQQLLPPPPPPPFEPLFALLTNTTTGATVHPRVHYLFSDDDTSIPTDEPTDPDDAAGDQHHRRSLVVDLAPTPARDAWAVSCASSLGPAFAVTGAALSKQQAGDGNATDASPSSGGGGGGAALMLHVEGVSRDAVDLRASAEADGSSLRSLSGSGAGGEDVEGLAEDFRRRMGVLKKVVGEGEKRRAASSAAQQEQHDEAEAGSHEIHDPGALRSETASQSHGAATSTS